MLFRSHAERNFAAAREPKAMVELDGEHNDSLLANRAAYVAGAEKLVQFAEAGARPKRPVGLVE